MAIELLFYNCVKKRQKLPFAQYQTTICSTVFQGYASLRPFLYFDLNLTSTFLAFLLRPKLYFDQNFTSIKTVLRPKLYFDQNFTLIKTLLPPKLYFDQNCTWTCASRPIRNPDLTKCRSTEGEVKRSNFDRRNREAEVELSKYIKGRTDAQYYVNGSFKS